MQDGTVHVWVGTDIWQYAAGAELALEHSIRKHASVPVELHWMRAGPPDNPHTAQGYAISEHGSAGTWKVHRPIEQAWPKRGWGTPFSTFRCSIPEMMGFQGRAIYLDADMVVLGDIAELYNWPTAKPWLCNHPNITDVSVIDCAAFRNQAWWPTLAGMRSSGMFLHEGRTLLQRHGFMDTSLPWKWNMRDDLRDDTRLVHYTAVPWQPWHPYPTVKYQPHPRPDLVDLFQKTMGEARASLAARG